MVSDRQEYQHAHYERNKEKKRIQSKQMRDSWSDEYRLWRGSRDGATKRNLEYTLSVEDIVIPSVCPVLGIPLLRSGRSQNSVSIDRINNSKGYTKNNIRLISRRANRLKADASIDEIKSLYLYMLEHSSKE